MMMMVTLNKKNIFINLYTFIISFYKNYIYFKYFLIYIYDKNNYIYFLRFSTGLNTLSEQVSESSIIIIPAELSNSPQ